MKVVYALFGLLCFQLCNIEYSLAGNDDNQKDFHVDNQLQDSESNATLKFTFYETHQDKDDEGNIAVGDCQCDYVKYTPQVGGDKENLTILTTQSNVDNPKGDCFADSYSDLKDAVLMDADSILKMHTKVKSCSKHNNAKIKFSLFFSEDQVLMADIYLGFHRQSSSGTDDKYAGAAEKLSYASFFSLPVLLVGNDDNWSTDTKIVTVYNGFNVIKGDNSEIKIKPAVTTRFYVKNDAASTVKLSYSSNNSSYDADCTLDTLSDNTMNVGSGNKEHIDINLVRCVGGSAADIVFNVEDYENDIVGTITTSVEGNNKSGEISYSSSTYSQSENDDFSITQDDKNLNTFIISDN